MARIGVAFKRCAATRVLDIPCVRGPRLAAWLRAVTCRNGPSAKFGRSAASDWFQAWTPRCVFNDPAFGFELITNCVSPFEVFRFASTLPGIEEGNDLRRGLCLPHAQSSHVRGARGERHRTNNC